MARAGAEARVSQLNMRQPQACWLQPVILVLGIVCSDHQGSCSLGGSPATGEQQQQAGEKEVSGGMVSDGSTQSGFILWLKIDGNRFPELGGGFCTGPRHKFQVMVCKCYLLIESVARAGFVGCLLVEGPCGSCVSRQSYSVWSQICHSLECSSTWCIPLPDSWSVWPPLAG